MTKLQFSDLSFRTPKQIDLIELRRFLESADLPTNDIENHLNNFILLFAGETLIGTAGMEIYSDKALLRSFAIIPAKQKNGLGTLLFRKILDKAELKNIRTLYLLTATAVDFFSSLGFSSINRERIDYRVRQSTEFQLPQCSSAVCMKMDI